MNKKIPLLSSLFVLLYVVRNVVQNVMPFPDKDSFLSVLHQLIYTFSPKINLTFFIHEFLRYHKFDSNWQLNFLDLGLFFLILVGTLIYLKSRGREVRLLRFTISIVLLSKVISLLSYFIYVVGLMFSDLKVDWLSWLYVFLSFISIAGFLYLSHYIYQELSKGIEVIKNPSTLKMGFRYVETPVSQRFFHYIVDLFLSIVIGSNFVFRYIYPAFSSLEPLLNGQITQLLFIMSVSLIFYLFFEGIFKTTPAKMLTGSRVVNEDGKPVSFITILNRTFIRKIPLEPFTFIGVNGGIHDTWTETEVVKEVNNGVPIKRYWWIVVLMLFVGFGSYGIKQYAEYYSYYSHQKGKFEHKLEAIEKKFETPNSNQFYIIERVIDKNRWYQNSTFAFKLEKVKDGMCYFRFFNVDYNLNNINKMEIHYLKNKETLPLTRVPLEILEKAIVKDYDRVENKDIIGQQLINDRDEKFYIKDIHEGFKVDLYLEDGSYYKSSKQLFLRIRSQGWPGEIVEIVELGEGNNQWRVGNGAVPVRFRSGKRGGMIRIGTSHYEEGESFAFEIHVQDTIGRMERYRIEGDSEAQKLIQID